VGGRRKSGRGWGQSGAEGESITINVNNKWRCEKMRKQKLHCNKKKLATREQHVAKPTATSTKDERENRERERAEFIFEIRISKRVPRVI